jgi:flagellar M-ring protein FliF
MATTLANPADINVPAAAGNSQAAEVLESRAIDQSSTLRQPGALSPQAQGASSGITTLLVQPAVRKAMPAIIVLMAVGLFLLTYSWIQAPPYKAVYPGLSESDRQAAYTALTGSDFSAKIDNGSGELMVPGDRYHEARIFLASRGLPQGAAAGGMSSLNEDTSMTTSQFMEQVRYVSAMEQELAQSIIQIGSIKSARVHLASPKQSVFVRSRTPAKASVVVTPFGGRVISSSQVEAIIHMVASSIPYLSADNVSVVDQRGKLLTDANNFASMQLNSEQMAHKQRMEETYRNRIDAFLTPVVGLGNVRSEVDIQIDFTEIESTFEEYDGNDNGPLARSEIVTLEQDLASDAAKGIPGAESNIPGGQTLVENGSFDGKDEGMSTRSSQTTRNYEMDKAIRHVKRQGGTLERISVAVVINEAGRPKTSLDSEGADIATNQIGYSNEDIQRFTNLVKGVVGFKEDRGDIITIVSAPFEEPAFVEEEEVPWYENTQITSMLKSAGAVVAFIALIFFVIRPVMKPFLDSSSSSAGKDGELTQAELNMLESGNNASLKDLQAKLKPKRATVSADMLNTANTYDDKVSLVRLLVADDAGRVANVLKKMIRPV